MVVCKYFQQGYCRFGHYCRNEHVYSSKYSYRAPQTDSTRTGNENLDSNASGHGFGNSNASALIRSAVQNTSVFQNPASASVFYSNPAIRSSVFDRLGPQQNQAKSIFAQANQSTFSPMQPNVFHTQNQVTAKSLFAQTNQNIFGQSQTNFNQAQSLAANVFATANHNLPSDPFKQQQSNPFTNCRNVVQVNNQPSLNPFTNCRNVVQVNNQPSLNPLGVMAEQYFSVEDNVYSKMEDLAKSDIEAFESVDFKLGFVPEKPPPRTLCV